ncbi:medium chain dehydrogenase/reductase family protein [Desulfosarcina sp.]|uniref:synaptic vesicle VAT-1 family membrane protein n=1 Tax=Desulfosarcina sp. TaxID=2027861 RepID=UPI0029B18C86|nr:medium chain dehydrogenase/reductase family protein [Desulfosarcina sp.]MDX2454067.1 medium chain dehydrogenase/reductase family protein [Desulfosarcina sp.]MDX2491754.1 medium chain dehydrogenase/reductase family protein [Desulfosarcina sp.]
MKQIVITKYGDPDVLKIQERKDPQPSAEEVLIKVKAIGVNFADILARKGLYPDAPKPPCVVGYEVSGTVESAGPGVDASIVGQSVVALTRFNGYSDRVCVPEKAVFTIPESLDFEHAAAIPLNYLTAYQLLYVMGGLKKGESVLIHNAGGGVGLAALDISLHLEATTYGTSSVGKHSFLMERGLNYPIDYRNQDFLSSIMNLTGGKGVEMVLDPIGGNNWKKSYKALRPTGRLGLFGVSTVTDSTMGRVFQFIKLIAQTPRYNPLRLMNANKGVFGVNLGHMWNERDKISGWMQEILKGVEKGWVRPHVDRTFRFEQAGKAHRYIEARKNIGKIVLVTGG